MPLKRRRAKGRARALRDDEYWELILGPGGRGGSAFESPFLRRAAWHLHKEELLADHGAGDRPWGFWEYEIGKHPADVDIDIQARELRRRGLLEPWEVAELLAAKQTKER